MGTEEQCAAEKGELQTAFQAAYVDAVRLKAEYTEQDSSHGDCIQEAQAIRDADVGAITPQMQEASETQQVGRKQRSA